MKREGIGKEKGKEKEKGKSKGRKEKGKKEQGVVWGKDREGEGREVNRQGRK